ncbi:NADP-dependent oxidoreductase domain-containing protein, partial [Lipomyces tetrasporus]
MSIGDAWSGFMGSMDKATSFKLLDAYYEAGGNFIDTANNYQNEQSEIWLGEWMSERKNRDQIVIATKFTSEYKGYSLGQGKTPNNCGNHKRSFHMSVRDSLKKFDILYLHWWDYTTSIEEIMDGLHILVEPGKVLYLGISDTLHGLSAQQTFMLELIGRRHSLSTMVDVMSCCATLNVILSPWHVISGWLLRRGMYLGVVNSRPRKRSKSGRRKV